MKATITLAVAAVAVVGAPAILVLVPLSRQLDVMTCSGRANEWHLDGGLLADRQVNFCGLGRPVSDSSTGCLGILAVKVTFPGGTQKTNVCVRDVTESDVASECLVPIRRLSDGIALTVEVVSPTAPCLLRQVEVSTSPRTLRNLMVAEVVVLVPLGLSLLALALRRIKEAVPSPAPTESSPSVSRPKPHQE